MEMNEADRAMAGALETLPGIRAVAIGGSRATGFADAGSDTDVYAFHDGLLPTVAERRAALAPHADAKVESTDAFGPEDHLTVDGRDVEVVYLDLRSLSDEVDRAQGEGLMGEGFTTCFLFTVATCAIVADPDGTLQALKDRLRTYPAATQRRILDETPALLDTFLEQLTAAQRQGDLLMVTHRRAAIQAAWFNALFALNAAYHPGEKRLLEHAASVPVQPRDLAKRWSAAALEPADNGTLAEMLAALIQDLSRLSATVV